MLFALIYMLYICESEEEQAMETTFQWPGLLTLLMVEAEYSGFFDQFHSCWCPGDFRSQGISRHGIDSIE